MKKKILALSLCVALLAVAVVGGTLAYFTDTDDATNTFTIGNVKIELIEEQRALDEDGNKTTDLEDFEQDKILMPIVGSAQGDKDDLGMPVAANYVDKIVTVKNLAADAYVRVYAAFPSALDNTANDSLDILHNNIGNRYCPDGGYAGTQSADYWDNWSTDPENMSGYETLVAENVVIDGIEYNVYAYTYQTVLSKDEITKAAAIVGVYLDKDVDYDTENECYTVTRNGETTEIDFDFSNGVTVPVFAVGCQAAGFDDAETALNAAFGENYNPWAPAPQN